MIIMITLDTNYYNIWEKSGIATFDSKYEGIQSIKIIQESLHENLYAIGLYRARKSLPQPFPPSLLQITKATLLENCRKHDIRIHFNFLKKLPIEFNTYLQQILPDSRPLICYIRDSYFSITKRNFFDVL
jgi:hypothetical protein